MMMPGNNLRDNAFMAVKTNKGEPMTKAKKKTKLKNTKAIRTMRVPKDAEPLDMANIAAPIGVSVIPQAKIDALVAYIREHLEKHATHGGQAATIENVIFSVRWKNNSGATYQSFFTQGFSTNAQKLELVGQLEALKHEQLTKNIGG